MEGMLERSDERFLLSTRLKFPSKSISNLPVIVRFGEGSSHSKLVPMRDDRAFTWNSGEFPGPESIKTLLGCRRNPGSAKSSPYAEQGTWTNVAFRKPNGVTRRQPMLPERLTPSLSPPPPRQGRIGVIAGLKLCRP